MKRLALLAVLLSGCASLKAGWARVTWVNGGVAPVVACTARVGPEGDVEMTCSGLNDIESAFLWKREEKRTRENRL